MRKQFTIFLFLLTTALGNGVFAQSKIAHVNARTVVDTIPSRKKALKEIQEITKQSEAELHDLDQQLQKAYNDYMSNKAEQSATVNQYEESRIQKMQQNLQDRQQELDANIQKLNMALNESTYKLVKDAVQTIASKKGLLYVIDQEAALFSGGTDVTSEVIAEVLKLDTLTAK